MRYQAYKILLLLCLYCTVGCKDRDVTKLKIAYVSYQSGSADIYLMNADGSDIEQITSSEHNNSFPFQIDKETIGFTRFYEDRTSSKFQVNVYSKEVLPLEETAILSGAKWEEASPDDRKVAFVRSTDYSDRELYIYDRETQSERKITSNKDSISLAYSINHSWSSDGSKLLFMSGPDWYNQYIRYYDLKNDSIITVTDRGYMNSGLLWLNDDKTLFANLKIRDKTYYELYTVDLNSGEVKQITKDINLHPSLSSDGQKIIYESQRNGDDGDIYYMNVDGTNEVQVTSTKEYEGRAIWFEY